MSLLQISTTYVQTRSPLGSLAGFATPYSAEEAAMRTHYRTSRVAEKEIALTQS